jgi:ATP-dependent Clp protease adaptor protein ClpS
MEDRALNELVRLVSERDSDVAEERRTRGRSVHQERWLVVVMNDDHNTFEGVAVALSQTLPNTTFLRGLELADEIHDKGRATVWGGHFEAAEYFWARLDRCRLSMAPLCVA